MQMKFYSPLTADFFPNEPDWENESYNEYEGCPLDGHDLLQYADAVDEAVKKDIADFNGDLMQYYHEDDSVRSKVVSAVPSVKICGNKLCGCLTVELKETLLDDEQTVLCNYISGQLLKKEQSFRRKAELLILTVALLFRKRKKWKH